MAKKPDKRCPECGGAMRYESREDYVEYKGQRRTFKNMAWWCTACPEGIQDGAALKLAERAFIELRAEVEDVLLPEEVAEVRQRLEISQREAGRVLGGGPRAFQKYESGKVPVSGPMKNLLVLLKNDPSRLAELRRKPARPARLKKRPQRSSDTRTTQLAGIRPAATRAPHNPRRSRRST
jgi:HTH-type transcriptional regulator / antitoxin MqsA